MEGLTMLSSNKLISLSEQELLDCDSKGYNMGCNGGLMDYAYTWIANNNGLNTDTNYPYVEEQRSCNTTLSSKSYATISGYSNVGYENETALKISVARQPVSAAIEGGSYDFQFYSGGIFNGSCGFDLDHAVTIVGYGTENGTNYWYAKNSWGTSWGENGYLRIKRDYADKRGLCGIAMLASYPTC